MNSVEDLARVNTEPSLDGDILEGATTRAYDLEQVMKPLHSSEWKRGTLYVYCTYIEDMVYSA